MSNDGTVEKTPGDVAATGGAQHLRLVVGLIATAAAIGLVILARRRRRKPRPAPLSGVDTGLALVELLARVADSISDRQVAVAGEGKLDGGSDAVRMGEGVSGARTPSAADTLRAAYRTGSGAAGNGRVPCRMLSHPSTWSAQRPGGAPVRPRSDRSRRRRRVRG